METKQYTYIDNELIDDPNGLVVGKELIDESGNTITTIVSQFTTWDFLNGKVAVQFMVFVKPVGMTKYLLSDVVNRRINTKRCCNMYGVSIEKEVALDNEGNINPGYFIEAYFFNEYMVKPALHPFLLPTIDRVYEQLKTPNWKDVEDYL